MLLYYLTDNGKSFAISKTICIFCMLYVLFIFHQYLNPQSLIFKIFSLLKVMYLKVMIVAVAATVKLSIVIKF